MSKITATQLVSCFQRYCAEKWGYVWGLDGELYTQAMADKFKAQGRKTSKWRDPATYWTEDCKGWIGKRAADCSGGIVCAMRAFIPGYGDRKANTFFAQCMETGKVSSIPEVPGLCVWRDGHIGIYEGTGYVIEFRGTGYGCVRTKLSQRNFTHWGRLRDVDYGSQAELEQPAKPAATVLTITSPLMRGEAVAKLQSALNGLGYPCGTADGIYGKNTLAGVQAFIHAHQ